MLDFENKVAVVTGGASGIGRALGRKFVREGARRDRRCREGRARRHLRRELAARS
jgi:NAD(P)-dependent dehydrogenase (short-subunit alcohol dehydrogenase family)